MFLFYFFSSLSIIMDIVKSITDLFSNVIPLQKKENLQDSLNEFQSRIDCFEQ